MPKSMPTIPGVELVKVPFLAALQFVAPHNLSIERAAALQEAFFTTIKGANFLAEVNILNVELGPLGGADNLNSCSKPPKSPRN